MSPRLIRSGNAWRAAKMAARVGNPSARATWSARMVKCRRGTPCRRSHVTTSGTSLGGPSSASDASKRSYWPTPTTTPHQRLPGMSPCVPAGAAPAVMTDTRMRQSPPAARHVHDSRQDNVVSICRYGRVVSDCSEGESMRCYKALPAIAVGGRQRCGHISLARLRSEEGVWHS